MPAEVVAPERARAAQGGGVEGVGGGRRLGVALDDLGADGGQRMASMTDCGLVSVPRAT